MADINAVDPTTGLAQLHVAVGINRFDLVRTLVDQGARFFPDKHGRMPSLIAALCEVDEDLMNFVVECEERQEDPQVERLQGWHQSDDRRNDDGWRQRDYHRGDERWRQDDDRGDNDRQEDHRIERLPERRRKDSRRDDQEDSQSRRQDDNEKKLAAAPRDKDKKPGGWNAD
jgi:hypothetical protein